jgi:hypothetical protein
MTTVSTRALAILIVGIVVLAGSSVLAEGIPYYTDFSTTPTGQLPEGWANMDANATWTVNDADELVRATVVSGEDSSVVYTASGMLTDFTVSSKFHFTESSSARAGVVGRQSSAEVFYVARVTGTTTNYVDVYWNDPSQGTGYGRIVHQALSPGYISNDMCTISLKCEGSNIGVSVRNSSNVEIGSKTVVDSHITSGYAGVRSNTDAFGCTEFQVIPEPGAVALLISALAGLAIVRRKR